MTISTPTAYWKLDEASGNASDSIGAQTLTDNNTVTSAAGKQGTARQFTAANSESLSRANNATVQTGDVDFTFSCWVYADTLGGGYHVIIGKDGAGAGDREYVLEYDAAATAFKFTVFRATDAFHSCTGSTFGAASTGTWYHLVCWHDAASDIAGIAINGVTNTVATTGALQVAGTAAFRLGARDYGGAEGYWDGRIDEVGFWKQVLTSAERTQLYNSGTGVTYPFPVTAPAQVFGAADFVTSVTGTADFVPSVTGEADFVPSITGEADWA